MKKHTISGSYIFQQNYQKENLVHYALIQLIIQNEETADFNDFMSKVTTIIRKNFFGSKEDIKFCKIYSIEINKSLLYEHNNSTEHRDIEKYFIVKCMTYCEVCNKEIRNDVWREHLISANHLKIGLKIYCMVSKTKYDVSE